MHHLANVRSGEIDLGSAPEGLIETMNALAVACKNARGHVWWKCLHLLKALPCGADISACLRPLKKNMLRHFQQPKTSQTKMITEVKGKTKASADVESLDIGRDDAISLIKTSHIMLGLILQSGCDMVRVSITSGLYQAIRSA